VVRRDSRGESSQVRHFATGLDVFRRQAHVGSGGRTLEQLGIGMLRMINDLHGGADFHQRSGVQHRHPVTHVACPGQIVRDKEHAQAFLILQVQHQIHHVEPDRHVQGAGGFIGQNQFGLRGQGAGNPHPLPLPARQFKGPFGSVYVGRSQAHPLQQPVHLRVGVAACEAVNLEGPRQRVAHRMQRVEAAVRVLKDHLDPPPQLPQPLAPQFLRHGLSIQPDFAGSRLMEAGDQAGDGAFAAARFAHQPQHLAAPDAETHVVDGHHAARFVTCPEYLPQVHDFQRVRSSRVRNGTVREGRWLGQGAPPVVQRGGLGARLGQSGSRPLCAPQPPGTFQAV
jgi:hypothetical protein